MTNINNTFARFYSIPMKVLMKHGKFTSSVLLNMVNTGFFKSGIILAYIKVQPRKFNEG